jgi:hypothetical protein
MRTLAVFAAVGVRGVLGVCAASARAPAVLSLQTRDPVSIRGVGFKPAEWVRVRVRGGLAQPGVLRVVRAGPGGTFLAVFPSGGASRCDRVRIVALGGRGSTATLKALPSPACLPDRAPGSSASYAAS